MDTRLALVLFISLILAIARILFSSVIKLDIPLNLTLFCEPLYIAYLAIDKRSLFSGSSTLDVSNLIMSLVSILHKAIASGSGTLI
jgi:hypothetical protein